MVEISGLAPARFARVKDAFAANFAAGEELGCRFTLAEAGEVVLDLWGGHADRAGTRAFDETTLTPIFSTGKAVGRELPSITKKSHLCRRQELDHRTEPPPGCACGVSRCRGLCG